jgi:myo-inositol-1(or 4)-monophosphatase
LSDDIDPAELRELARQVAADTGQFLLTQLGAVADETKSSPTDFVTEVDRAAEARIVAALGAERPHDGFKGEEGTELADTSGVRWIIDPIDGTANFVYGHPGFGVSIAAEVHGTVVAGAVADPTHGDVFDAALGSGALCNGEPIAARPTADLSVAIVATGFSFAATTRAIQAESLAHILPRIGDIRRMGSAALDLCGVAVGRVDAYWEHGLNEWDIAAGALIAAEAGAVVKCPAPGDVENLTIAAAPGIAEAFFALVGSASAR